MQLDLQQMKIKQLLDFSFWFFVFSSVISEHSIIGTTGLLFFLVVSVMGMIRRNSSIIINGYISAELLFIIFCTMQILMGFAFNRGIAENRLITLIICFIFDVCFYNYLLFYKDWKTVLKFFVSACCAGMVILVLIDFNSFISGRFGTSNTVGKTIFGIHIGGVNATMIGYLAMIGFLFATIVYTQLPIKKKLFFYDIFFIIMMLASGTRKVLPMIPLIIFVERFNRKKTDKILWLLAGVIILIIALIMGYYAILYIPALYNSAGYRVEALLFYLKEGSTNDSSIITRMRLIERAKNAFIERPWMGWGLNNFKYIINKGGYYAHNNFYEILVSVGLTGFAVYYSKYVYTIGSAIRSIKHADFEDKCVLKLLLFFIVCAIVLEYWQVTYFYRMFMIPFSMLISISQISENQFWEDHRNQ